MASQTKYPYGLEFSEGTVALVRVLGEGSFEFVKKAKVESSDFAAKMAEMHDIVSEDRNKVLKLPLFLRKVDTPVVYVPVDEDGEAIDLEDVIAEDAQTDIANLSYVLGQQTQDGQAVIFAKRDLMEEANSFVEHFKFSAAYFAPRIRFADFDDDIIFETQKPFYKTSRFQWSAAIAAMLLVGVGVGLGAMNSNLAWQSEETPNEASAVVVQSDQSNTGISTPVSQSAQNAIPAWSAPTEAFAIEDTLTAAPENQLRFTRNDQIVPAPNQPADENIIPLIQLTGVFGEPPKYVDDGVAAETENILAQDDVDEGADDAIDLLSADAIEGMEPSNEAITDEIASDAALAEAEDDRLETAALVIGGAEGRPPRRPDNLNVVDDTSTDTALASDAIANDLLEQAIESDAERNENLENASRFAAVVTSRPPRKTNRWTTNLALVQESKRIAAANVVENPEAETAVVEEDEKDARRVSNTFRRNQLSLIGVVGAPSSRRAIFRTSSGSIRTLKQGQRISGWQLVAIGESSVKVTRQGRERTMRLP